MIISSEAKPGNSQSNSTHTTCCVATGEIMPGATIPSSPVSIATSQFGRGWIGGVAW